MADRFEPVWLDRSARFTLIEVSECCGLSETMVRELVEFGAVAPEDAAAREWAFSGDCVARLRIAARLRDDLDLETHTLALVMGFLDRIGELEAQVRRLTAQVSMPLR